MLPPGLVNNGDAFDIEFQDEGRPSPEGGTPKQSSPDLCPWDTTSSSGSVIASGSPPVAQSGPVSPMTQPAASTSQIRLPLPTAPNGTGGPSSATASAISLRDGCEEPHVVNVEDLSQEDVRNIKLAADGRSLETSSAALAMELRKRFDRAHGVNLHVRSPWSIVNFNSQHGYPLYRLGPRDMPAPAESGLHAADTALTSVSPRALGSMSSISSKAPASKSTTRLTRMLSNVASVAVPSASRGPASAQPAGSSSTDVSGGRRRLRKTHSIPEKLNAPGASPTPAAAPVAANKPSRSGKSVPQPKRQHSHTVSTFGPVPLPALYTDAQAGGSALGLAPPPAKRASAVRPPLDLFGEVMRGGLRSPFETYSGMSPSGGSAMSRKSPMTMGTSSLAWSGFGSTSAVDLDLVPEPFGPGVAFDDPEEVAGPTPSRAVINVDEGSSDGQGDAAEEREGMEEEGHAGRLGYTGRLNMSALPKLRMMQSFESGMTARAGDHGRPTRLLGLAIAERAPEGIEEHPTSPSSISPAREERSDGPLADTETYNSPADQDSAVVVHPPPSDEPGDVSPSLRMLAEGAERFLANDDTENDILQHGSGATTSQIYSATQYSVSDTLVGDVIPPLDLDQSAPSRSASSHSSIPSDGGRVRLPTLGPAARAYQAYTTEIWDILQRSRGIPRLDELIPSDRMFSLSYQDEKTGQPKNDPRFVVWADVIPMNMTSEASGAPNAEAGTDPSGGSSSAARSPALSRAQSTRARKLSAAPSATPSSGKSAPGPAGVSSPGSPSPAGVEADDDEDDEKDNIGLGAMPPPVRVMVAATIERWIAQLTSKMDYDELLMFFLTYRTYISPFELAHYLISRFHWSLEPGTSAQDDSVRSIVRARTFVVIRYWLVKFFTVDFVPNTDMRIYCSQWLNALKQDPLVKARKDAEVLVLKIIKHVKDCRIAYMQSSPARRSLHGRTKSKSGGTPTSPTPHRISMKSTHRRSDSTDEDSDLELDFLASTADLHQEQPAFQSLPFKDLPPEGPLSRASGIGSPGAVTHGRFPSLMSGASNLPLMPPPLQQQNALSRAFTNTLTRVGRWRRGWSTSRLNQPMSPPNETVKLSAFDLDFGLVEQGGEAAETRSPPPSFGSRRQFGSVSAVTSTLPSALPSAPRPLVANLKLNSPPVTSTQAPAPATVSKEEHVAPGSEPALEAATDLSDEEDNCQPTAEPALHAVLEATDEESVESHDVIPAAPVYSLARSQPVPLQYQSFDDAPSYRSSMASSRFSFERPVETAAPAASLVPRRQERDTRRSWQLDVVSIDELELSDLSDSSSQGGPSAPPGLRKPTRRLPQRRDFDFAPRPESVSSMGLESRNSFASSSRSSAAEENGGMTLGATIEQWQVNAIVDDLTDEEGGGDVDAALRRLEGQISHSETRVKQTKVDGWLRQIRERLAAGDYGDEPSRFPTSDNESDEEDYGEARRSVASIESAVDTGNLSSSVPPVPIEITPSENELEVPHLEMGAEAITPVADRTAHLIKSPPLTATDAKPSIEDAVPFEIREGRVALPDAPHTPAVHLLGSPPVPTSFPPIPSGRRRAHKPWVIEYTAQTIAEHFAMIDRELFTAIKFDELIAQDALSSPEEANVLDWAQFLKDRATAKAEGRQGPKTSSLVAVRARFNLVANFVMSEILLAPPAIRSKVFSKFVHVAYRAQGMNNYSTQMAVMAGLQHHYTEKSMKRHWSQVSHSDRRTFTIFQTWCTAEEDFKFIRQNMEALEDAMKAPERAPSIISGGKTKASMELTPPASCIPFVGVYLSQIARISELPDLIDPTAPHHPVSFDPETSKFSVPAQPEVFSALPPLPEGIAISPLVNVQKQRRLASVVRSLVCGQHLAHRVGYTLERRTYQKCLRLHGLGPEELYQASTMWGE